MAYRVSQGNLINNFSVGTANCGIADTVESGGIVQKCYSLETSSNSNFNVMNGTEKEVKACDASYMTSGDFLNKLNENIGDHIDWFDWIVDTQESQNPIISPIINLEDCSVEFGIGTAAIVYDGTPKTIAVTITYNGKTLVEGEDYAVSYQTNVNAGNATAVVTGVGQYSGSDMTSFTIEPRTLADAVITTSASSFTYTGNAMIPNVYVKVGNRTLEKDKDYTITFSNNVQVGTASYVIQGIGNYKESRQGTYEIKAAPENPPAGGTPSTGGSSNTEVNNQGTGNSVTPLKVSATKITKVTGKKKSFVVKWKKMSKVAGYQIRYSTKKSMGGAKKKTISSKKSSVTVKNLKSKKKYYVQVRVYKVDSNQNSVYSSWSARKMIKTK